jgi:orotate phosphoribosyltransferase
VVASCADLRERGATVEHALCVIDRQAGGPDALAKVGVELRPLVTMQELERAAART